MKLLHASFLSLAVLLATVRSAPHGNATEIAEVEHDAEYAYAHDLYEREADAEDVSGFDDEEDTDELIARGIEDLNERVDDDDLDLDEDESDEHEFAARDFDEELDVEVEELDDDEDFGHELTAREAAYELEGFDEEDSVLQTRATSGHLFYFVNKCKSAVQPAFADTRCGYSPRCGDASSYKGKQPAVLKPGKTSKYRVPNKWVGRVFNKRNKRCGAKGENCTMGEFNLDTGSQWTPQAYDISNIQGFTQSMAVKGEGCPQVTCRSVKCSCKQAYPPGDMAGKCGTNAVDQPVRACGKGGKAFRVTFCP